MKANSQIHKFTNSQIHKLILLIVFIISSYSAFSQTAWPQVSAVGSSEPAGIRLEQRGYNNSLAYQWDVFNHANTHGFCIYDRTKQAYRFYIDENGNTGIGSSIIRPGCVLTVKGKIAAQEFEIVSDVTLPDYVFKKDYKLRPLKDLELFINTHSHLPEVPSADSAKQNGYKVMEMNNLLLKKVEELTLYTIELNKQVESLKAEMATLKGEK